MRSTLAPRLRLARLTCWPTPVVVQCPAAPMYVAPAPLYTQLAVQYESPNCREDPGWMTGAAEAGVATSVAPMVAAAAAVATARRSARMDLSSLVGQMVLMCPICPGR